jgi:RNA polymerase sigma-70 factor (ECF subfamily)
MNDDRTWLADEFEVSRPYLRGVAYRMLGSVSEADDALQEAWLRLDRANADRIEDLRAWLTTVVARICLDMLRSRRVRREESGEGWLPEPIVADDTNPEDEALIADSVGLALLIVLEHLSPAERVAFVLHDVFAMSFEEISDVVGRSPEATRQLASRGRRRVHGATPPVEKNPKEQRRVVDAFLAASRAGDLAMLLEVLDPDVVFRADMGVGGPRVPALITGSDAVAEQVLTGGTPLAALAKPVLVNGSAGVVVGDRETPIAVVSFVVRRGRILEIDLIADPKKIRPASG